MQNNNLFLKQTYGLLALSLIASCIAAYICMQVPSIVAFMGSPLGWLFSIISINVYPLIAIKFAEDPDEGFLAKVVMTLNGFMGGIVLSPLLFIVSHFSKGMFTGNQLIFCAIGLTGAVFTAVTYYVFNREYRYDFHQIEGFMWGLALSLVAAIPLNALILHSGFVGWIILSGMGLLGTYQLVSGTVLLADGSEKNPVVGALILYAGLFNLFQVILVTLYNITKDGK